MEHGLNEAAGSRSPDGRFLARPGEQHTVLILNAQTQATWATYYGHQAGLYRRVGGIIRSLAWLADGNRIVSGSSDGSIHVWEARTGIHQRTLTEAQEGCPVLALAVSSDGSLTALREGGSYTWRLC